MADKDDTEGPAVRLTPTKRPQTVAQERPARGKRSPQDGAGAPAPAPAAVPRKAASEAPAKAAAKPVAAKKVVAKKVAAKKVVAKKVAAPASSPTPPATQPAGEAAPEKSWSTPAPTSVATPSPTAHLPGQVPDPQPGVPIAKTHVLAVAGVMGLLVLRRRRRGKKA
ncbi:MAG: hypothetical protein JWM02_760 [Frankiales bacterium]|nr:hypothetical protein [Frankiales bacterium]